MLAAYSIQDSGYASLMPKRELGDDLATAMYLVGKRVGQPLGISQQKFVLVTSAGQRISEERTIQDARLKAVQECCHGPVTIYMSVARGRTVLYDQLERIEIMSVGESVKRDDVFLVTPTGTLVEKALNTRSTIDMKAFSKRMANQLQQIDRKFIQPHLNKMLKSLKLDWSKMSKADIERAFKAARKTMRAVGTSKLLPSWNEKVKSNVEIVANATRKYVKNTFAPRISLAFSQPDMKAVEQISTQQGWFLRDEYGRRSDALTNRGRVIVEDGLKKGLGPKSIGSNLREALPKLWEGRGKAYSEVVAANAVSRARSTAELASYQTAGFKYLEVQAMLDENTTEVCRYMDGQIIDVQKCVDLSQSAASVSKPEDIYKKTPFMEVRTRRDREGNVKDRTIYTRTGTKIAGIKESDMGRIDRRGKHTAFVSGSQLPKKGVGAPPYHHRCRTLTVPRIEMSQVPRNYEARSVQGPSPQPKGTRTRPSGLGVPRAIPTKAPQRPVDVNYAPPGVPIEAGVERSLDGYTLPDTFFKEKTSGRIDSILANKKNYGARLNFVQDPKGVNNYVKQGAAKPIKIGTGDAADYAGLNDATMFEGMPDGDQAMHYVLGAPGDEAMAAIVANEGAAGREMLYRLSSSGVDDVYLRVNHANLSQSRVRKISEKIKLGTLKSKEAVSFLEDMRASQKIPVKWGAKLDEVAKARTARVATTGAKKISKKPKGIPKSTLPPPPGPKVTPKPQPIPKPEPAKPAQSAGAKAMEEVKIGTRVTSARPSPDDMVQIARDEAAAIRFNSISVKGKKAGQYISEGKWKILKTKDSVSAYGGKFPNFKKASIPRDVNNVNVFTSVDMDSSFMNRPKIVHDIVEGEVTRGFMGVRDYAITDHHGGALFVRIDGSALRAMNSKARRDALSYLDSSLNREDFADAYKILRSNGVTVSNNVNGLYKNAKIDWSEGRLIPGVPVKEQAYARADAVKREIQEKMALIETDKTLTEAAKSSKRSKVLRSMIDASDEVKDPLAGKVFGQGVFGKGDIRLSQRQFKEAYAGRLSEGNNKGLMIRKAPQFKKTSGRAGYRDAGEIKGSRVQAPAAVEGGRGFQDVRHEYQHHLDRIGKNGQAARHLMYRNVTDGKVLRYGSRNNELLLPSRAKHSYSAKVYELEFEIGIGKDRKFRTASEWQTAMEDLIERTPGDTSSEFFTMAATDSESASELLSNYERCPDQVSGYIAMLRGLFVPF